MDDYKFYYGKEKDNYELGTEYFVHNIVISAVTRAEFVSDRISYVILKGRRCDITVLHVHALTDDRTDDMKESFHEDLDHEVHQLIS
jgi:uncharacterized protein YifN (PemK superfamily)